jgi:hypothetical protein
VKDSESRVSAMSEVAVKVTSGMCSGSARREVVSEAYLSEGAAYLVLILDGSSAVSSFVVKLCSDSNLIGS